MSRLRPICMLALVAAWLAVAPARATVFHARDEALALAFPKATRTEGQNFFLTPAQRDEIQRRAGAKLESDFLTVYAGYDGDRLLGHAMFDTHVVRTLPETILVVVTPSGEISATYVLAFYEPLEYLASDRWLEQFRGKRLADDLRVGRGIVGITGSTLTSHAVASGIRRALAIHAVLLGDAPEPERPTGSPEEP